MPWNGPIPKDPSFVREYAPQKAYTKGTVYGLQNVNPYDFSRGRDVAIHNDAELTRGGLLGGLLSGFLNLGQLLNDLAKALRGDGVFGPGPMKDIYDYQRSLNTRFDLLENVSGYCNLAMSNSWRIGGGQAIPIPFNDRIGPNKRASPFVGVFTPSGTARHGILIEEPGTWDARARVTTSSGSGSGNAQLYLSLWNKETRTLLSEARFDTFLGDRRSNTIIETFVIPPELAGKVVVCCTFAHPGAWWTVIGGDRPSRLSVNRWDITTEGGRLPGTGDDAPNGGDYS